MLALMISEGWYVSYQYFMQMTQNTYLTNLFQFHLIHAIWKEFSSPGKHILSALGIANENKTNFIISQFQCLLQYFLLCTHGYFHTKQKLHERVLSVLGCRYVDDVLIDAPYEISSEMIASMNIDEVVHGASDTDLGFCSEEDERYRHAKKRGIFYPLKNNCTFSMQTIFNRVQENHETFLARFQRKMVSETQHYRKKYCE